MSVLQAPRLRCFWLGCMVLSGLLVGPAVSRGPEATAPTPPMGWNSWDSYGLTVTEQEFLDNAAVLAKNLKKFGWQVCGGG